MYSNLSEEYNIDKNILNVIVNNWQTKMSVNQFKIKLDEIYIEGVYDFPEHLVPFKKHRWYLGLTNELKHSFLASAWIAYNEKTIAIEDFIINPFCRNGLRGCYAGLGNAAIKTVLSQTIIDEQYHILMCLEACHIARSRYNLQDLRLSKPSVIMDLEAEMINDDDQKDIIYFAFATVAEMTINSYLSRLSSDTTIQPLNKLSVELHRRDEASHSKIFFEIVKSIYTYLNPNQKEQFILFLKVAVNSFTHPDFTFWKSLLSYYQCDVIDDIRKSITLDSSGLQRDYHSLLKLLDILGIKKSLVI